MSQIREDGEPDVASGEKTLANYKLQYNALKRKLHEFPETTFIVWTGAALVRGASSTESGERAVAFLDWVRSEWDEPGDNIHVWDLFSIQTGGGLFLKDEYAAGIKDLHPNEGFCRGTAPLFCQRVVEVIEGRGDTGSLCGDR